MKDTSNTPCSVGFKRRLLAASVAAAMPLTAAYAQETKELPTAKATVQTEDSYKVDESTSHKYTQPLVDIAKTITIIPQSVMRDRNVDSLRDALRNVPGISLAAGEGGTPTGDQMSIRGFDARNNITIDGIRDIAGYTRDTYNIEAIEVAKGPGSAVYGRGAAGGSINLQTKTAKLEDFGDVSLRLGSESDYRAQLDANRALGETTALRVNLLSDDGSVAGRDEVENSKNAIAVSFATGIGTGSRFSLAADYQSQDNLPDYGLPWVPNNSGSPDRTNAPWLAPYEGSAPPVDFTNFYGNLHRDFEDIQAQSITAKYEYDVSSSTTLRTQARIGSVERQSIVTAPRFPFEPEGDVRVYGSPEGMITMADEKTRDTDDSLAVVQVDLVGSYQTGSIHHDVVTGVELAKEKFERWNYADIVDDNLDSTPVLNDFYNPDPNLSFTGQYARTDQDEEATGDTTAIYVFDTLTLNPQWKLSAGLRYDIFETEYFHSMSDPESSGKLASEDKELSWNFDVVYKPADNGSIYFGAGNSFSPSASDLTVSTRGNGINLDPEKTVSYELGTKWELFDGGLFTSAAIFRTEKTNALTDAPDGFFDPAEDDGRFEILDGKQRVDGLELSAAGNITEQFSVTAAYTFQDSEVVNGEGDDAVQEGYELAHTPDHSFSLWGVYDFNDKLSAGLGAQYVGERYNNSDPGGREKADDYMVLDMMVSYQASDQWSVQFNGSNLADEEYADQLGGGHFIPGEGRYISLTTRYSF